MGLDIHVMPLSRFLAGDYQSPLERAFGNKVVRVGTAKAAMPASEAKSAVAGLQQALSKALKTNVSWPDEGDTAFSEQFDFHAWHALRAFAAHQDHPAAEGFFRRRERHYWTEEHPEAHPGLAKIYKGGPSRFRHLIVHADNQGYYFPTDFPDPLILNPKAGTTAGSAVRLLRELDELNRALRMDRDWGGLQAGEAIAANDDPLLAVKHGWAFMHHCAKLAVQQRLPIIFDG